MFIYFSHERLAIPPASNTNIAHSQGCLSLGTFITESVAGFEECEKLLKGEVRDQHGKIAFQDPRFYADKLVQICKYYGFDGYLLNIENKVSNTQKLLEWIKYLTDKIHQEIPGRGTIVWYDSVTVKGDLQW